MVPGDKWRESAVRLYAYKPARRPIAGTVHHALRFHTSECCKCYALPGSETSDWYLDKRSQIENTSRHPFKQLTESTLNACADAGITPATPHSVLQQIEARIAELISLKSSVLEHSPAFNTRAVQKLHRSRSIKQILAVSPSQNNENSLNRRGRIANKRKRVTRSIIELLVPCVKTGTILLDEKLRFLHFSILSVFKAVKADVYKHPVAERLLLTLGFHTILLENGAVE